MREEARDWRQPELKRANVATCFVTVEAYTTHYRVLSSLRRAAPGKLREVDFSWPPPDNPLMLTEEDSAEERRRKASQALVFHPDKFRQFYGAALHPEEKKAVLARADEVSKVVIEMFKAHR